MNKKPLPKFASKEEEREFWANNDSTDYVDSSKAQHVVFPNLKPALLIVSATHSTSPHGYKYPCYITAPHKWG